MPPQVPPKDLQSAQILNVETDLPFDPAPLQERISRIFTEGLQRPDAEASFVLVDDQTIHELNREWRHVDAPTDVLSFPMQEGDIPPGIPIDLLGDVIVSIETAARMVANLTHQARVAQDLGVDPSTLQWSLFDEVTFLIIHGTLHLLGHDHAEAEEEAEMRAEEGRLMRLFLT